MRGLVRAGGLLVAAVCLLFLQKGAPAQRLWLVPPEIASTHFTVTINGVSTPVMHAAENIYFLNFEAKPRRVTHITVTADRNDVWAAGVEVQPWRLGIRPERNGKTIAFDLNGPAKISISRPGDFLGTRRCCTCLRMRQRWQRRPGRGRCCNFLGPACIAKISMLSMEAGFIWLRALWCLAA
jgi:hypothetical protein